MNKIKLILISIVAVILITLGITVAIQYNKINSLLEDLEFAVSNLKALLLENDYNKNEIRSLNLTVEQLNYFNDSILIKLLKTKDELKIKDLNLKELLYLKTLASKKDTIFILDTIFVEHTNIDTVIGDLWYNLKLNLEYPNKILVQPQFISEKSIVTHIKKETVNPPKKCKFARFFQRKHKVLVVTILEKSPYITTEEYQHVLILK